MIYLFGSEGNMGKRYQAIFRHLGLAYRGLEVGNILSYSELKTATHFLIATPTETHVDIIRNLMSFKKPILCEKPITKDLEELKSLLDENPTLDMVNQYRDITFDAFQEGYMTTYDYFKHGSDGLAWDCINILGLAEHGVELKETSPIWKCSINGSLVNISDMDMAYIKMIKRWYEAPRSRLDYIMHAHKKAREYEQSH
jgi:hypothetical protein